MLIGRFLMVGSDHSADYTHEEHVSEKFHFVFNPSHHGVYNASDVTASFSLSKCSKVPTSRLLTIRLSIFKLM